MSSVFHSISIQSSRRPSALKDIDYDHEINLIDHTKTTTRSRSRSASESNRRESLVPPEDVSARRHSDDQLRRKLTVREEIERRRYSKPKYQKGRLGDELNDSQAGQDVQQTANDEAPTDIEINLNDCASAAVGTPKSGKKNQEDRESTIDILYENQRGGFLCGMPLFSSQALGAADAPPWTNIAQKPSPTDITNAQVPDPTWEWAWKGWSVNHSEEVDEDGWEYSCMFSKKVSWHGPSWYNSFVRRRAWIRKRIKKNGGYRPQEAHRLNSDYFTIHPAISRSRSPSKAPSAQEGRLSVGQLSSQAMGEEEGQEDIKDIDHLMRALKNARIDRERTEAVENFIRNGGDDLAQLKDHMHEIMSQFIFQASRRLLLVYLNTMVDEEIQREENGKDDKEKDPAEIKRIDCLGAAVKAADEEVKSLEFWSDIKGIAEQGEIPGAVDESQGWDKKKWAGLDASGPNNMNSERKSSEVPPETERTEGETSGSGKGKEKA